MDVSNQRDLWDEVDAIWQLPRRAVGSLTSAPALGSPPTGAIARAIEQLSLSLANSPAAVHSPWDSVGHETGEYSSGLQGFTILEHAATREDYNIIGPVDVFSPISEDESLSGAGSSARYSLRSLPDKLADDLDSFHYHHGPLVVTGWPVAFNAEFGTATAAQGSANSSRSFALSGLSQKPAPIEPAEPWRASQRSLAHKQPAKLASLDASTPSPETNSPIGAGSSVRSIVEFLTESSSSDVDSFEEEQLPPATPELPVAFKVESGTALATQASPNSARPLEGSGLSLAAIDHAEPWEASPHSLANEQPAEAMSSVEPLTPRAARDGDSVQGYPPLDAPELPGEFNPDTDIDTNFSQEAAPQTPATPVASPPPSTPTAPAAATAMASQQSPVSESAPDIAGLTQTLSATDSPTSLGTSSPAPVNAALSAKLMKLKEVLNRHFK